MMLVMIDTTFKSKNYTVHFIVDTGTVVLLLGTDTWNKIKRNFFINSLDKSRVGWGHPTQSHWYS